MFVLAEVSQNDYPASSWQDMGKEEHVDTAGQEHIDAILALPFVNVEFIKSKKFKVCLDSVNGE